MRATLQPLLPALQPMPWLCPPAALQGEERLGLALCCPLLRGAEASEVGPGLQQQLLLLQLQQQEEAWRCLWPPLACW